MAVKLFEKYGPDRANAPTTAFPEGSLKNESVPGANDGTPLDQDWGNDYAGFDAALFAEAVVTANGAVDTATNSQRLEALKTLFKNITTLADAVATENAREGKTVVITDREYGIFQYQTGQTPNGSYIIACTGVPSLSLVLMTSDTIIPEQFGVIGDDAGAGVTNKTNFELMLGYVAVNGGTIRPLPRVYHITGDINLAFPGGQQQILKIVGAGSKGDTNTSTVFYFDTYVSGQTRGFYWGANMVNAHLEGFTIRGAGKTVLNDALQPVNGLDDSTSSFSNGLTMIDIAFRHWSGDGANIVFWFQQSWKACYARDCGGWGIVIDGDQTPLFDMTGGAFFRFCDAGALWIKRGNAVVIGWNGEDLPVGLKIGDTSTDRVRLDIHGANFERMAAGSTAIDVDEYSQINTMVGVASQGPETAGDTALYGIRFRRLNGYNRLQDYRPIWFASSNGDGIDIPIQIDAAEPGASLALTDSRDNQITMGYGPTTLVQGPGRNSAYKARGNEFGDNPIEMEAGYHQRGIQKRSSITHTNSVDGSVLDLDIADDGEITNDLYFLDADSGAVFVVLPPANSTSDDIVLTFKRIDGTANTVRLDTFGSQTIDGVDNWVLAAQYDSVTIIKPAQESQWFIVTQV